ncbi:hypothetical protein SAMN05421593_0448 [Chryseobacterium culicis]|uniref:Uncharacterized protein n=1 Tax=Chryseobacterium culicis TaxID=680127 RepID=A0A1H6H0T3_CHRCI|nr:hypothetical protein SAMN05421593_0448 [Chryseobacterium culicis]
MSDLQPDLDWVKTVSGSANLITILKKPDVSGFFDYTTNLKSLAVDNQNFISKKTQQYISHYKEKQYL